MALLAAAFRRWHVCGADRHLAAVLRELTG
jgi:hypothetical protein